MELSELWQFLADQDDIYVDREFDDQLTAYRLGGVEGQLVALVRRSQPVRISLRATPELSAKLRDQYETVLPGEGLDRDRWITVICTGQLSVAELMDLARLSYRLTLELPD